MTPAARVGPHRLAVYGTGDAEQWSSTHRPRVVLVHGTMDRASSLAKVARRLPTSTVRRYDRRGYGESTDGGVAATVDEHVADILDVIAGERCVVVGHSMGGVIALAAAARHPEVIRAVGAYEAPRPWSRPDDRPPDPGLDPGDAAERFMRRMIGDRLWERLPSGVKARRRAEGEALLADGASIRTDAAHGDGGLSVPVIAAHGSESDERHVTDTLALVGTTPGAVLRVVDGAGHGAHLTHPDAVAALVDAVVAVSDLHVAATQ
ncbi:MAG: alpha/beta fold hydrolase [Acidimicrobiales bacterium]